MRCGTGAPTEEGRRRREGERTRNALLEELRVAAEEGAAKRFSAAVADGDHSDARFHGVRLEAPAVLRRDVHRVEQSAAIRRAPQLLNAIRTLVPPSVLHAVVTTCARICLTVQSTSCTLHRGQPRFLRRGRQM